MRPVHSLVLSLTAALLAAGCAQAGETQPAPQLAPQLAQFIVKFRPASVACNAESVAAFASRSKLDLQWLRPMSGDACVLLLRARSPQAALATLQARPEVEWAEADALVRPNTP